MESLIYLLSYLVPTATDCYLDPDIVDPVNNQELRQLAHTVAHEESLSVPEAEKMLSCIRKYPDHQVVDKPPTKVTPYCHFTRSFLDPYRIKKGAEFYHQHRETLESAEASFEISPFLITAIIGVETNYGSFTGKHLAKEALVNVLLRTKHQNPRYGFFMRELKSLMHMRTRYNIDIGKLKTSFDGGIGLAQFMPSSYLAYAISAKSNTPNLFDPDDAIFSIANYLTQFGQRLNGPLASPIEPSESLLAKLEQDNSFTYQKNGDRQTWTYDIKLSDGRHMNWAVSGNFSDKPPVSSAETDRNTHVYRFTQNDGSDIYWETTKGFDAILTYNVRPHYAISVYLLAQAIHEYVDEHPQ